ncbi:MFS transporter [Bradyrhizobium sp. dw_78]|uniref:MFS transporter n=1 Tax=Bradyrhizobium sp. dw_78 TaxID=2719793 RepID=UPI001BD61AAA|nr:MFS transporter [Bradyrhizobium sp. dw_78]
MSIQAVSTAAAQRKTPVISGFHFAFVAAWLFCLLFYFMQYAVRSAPSVMLPELTTAFGLTTLGVSSLLGLYYYTYSTFAIIAGASLDRWGAKYSIPIGAVLLAVGIVMFGLGISWAASVGRLLQGAGAAFAFVGAVYLATHGFPARYLATAVGFTQCFGMLGGSAGQFVVAPLVHGPINWQQFWIYAGILTVIIAFAMLFVTPRQDLAERSKTSIWHMFDPYKTVLTNPQSYLCGICAGLLFLPTTVGDMIWGVSFLRDGWHIDYAEAVNRASMVPLGWVIGCPVLGYIADRMGRRKPVLMAGMAIMLAATLAILYLPANSLPPYLLGFLLGFGSGAAMIPYSIIKEVNPDEVKGSATGAINFIVFVMSAFVAPAYGWLLQKLAGGGALTLDVFVKGGVVGIISIVVAIILALFIRETGTAVRKAS